MPTPTPRFQESLEACYTRHGCHEGFASRLAQLNGAAENAQKRLQTALKHQGTLEDETKRLQTQLRGVLTSELPDELPCEVARRLASHRSGIEEFDPVITALKSEADAAFAELQSFATENARHVPANLLVER